MDGAIKSILVSLSESGVIAVEKDGRFIPSLENIRNVDVIHDDILSFLKKPKKFNKVISNIPYSISQDIVIELLKYRPDIIVLIVQKEFAEKLAGNGKLGLVVRDCAKVEVVRDVSARYFTPVAVLSSLVVIKQHKKLDERLWLFLKNAYRNKNRNVGNVAEYCPDELKNKKIHQLTSDEIRQIINPQRLKKGKSI